jgi:beta-glucosidase
MEIYKNPSYSFEERAADLVSRMTLEEKVSQVGNQASAIPRLGLPFYNYWSEASHGCFGPFKSKEMNFTSYPVCLAMAQSWDTDKLKEVTSAIADEARAYANTEGDELHFWCPTINMARDPRNGRSDENFGEDPLLSGKMAASYIQGLQGDDKKYKKAVATPKHYMMNSSENNRHSGSSNADEATIREYYARVFEYAIREGKAESIMTSYNRINGVPASANEFMLTTLLREEWGFNGFVVSDCGAVADTYSNPMFASMSGLAHYYAKDPVEASAMTLEAGTDMTCGMEHRKNLLKAVQEGMISEDVIDRALIRALTSRFRLGLFDDPAKVPYASIGKDVLCNESMQKLSVDMADDTIVLLKNDKGLLPLQKDSLKKVLVVGPNALYRQLGGYSAGSMCPVVDTLVNVMALDGIKNALQGTGAEVQYEKGWCSDKEFKKGGVMEMLPGMDDETMKEMMSNFIPENTDPAASMAAFTAPPRFQPEDPDFQGDGKVLFARALEAAAQADVVIVVAGTDDVTASEEHDRDTLELPYGQNEKIKELLKVNDNTVVVLTTLGTVTGDFMDEAHTLVNAHFAGQEQGTAIADILFGKVNPNAKLTATWYKNPQDLPDVNDYGLKRQDTYSKKPRTYMYFDGEVRFPFGYGLSFTTYEYSNLRLFADSLDAGDTLKVLVDVQNTGTVAGKEIVELYIRRDIPAKVPSNKPFRQLKAWKKVELAPGEKKTVALEVPLSQVTFWSNRLKKMIVEEGDYEVEVGPNSRDLPCKQGFHVQGTWQAQLATVYAVLSKQVYQPGETGSVRVSATLEDARHLQSDEYELTFTSSDRNVAAVDSRGVVSAVAPGAATITAAVTYQGITKECGLPVAVK